MERAVWANQHFVVQYFEERLRENAHGNGRGSSKELGMKKSLMMVVLLTAAAVFAQQAGTQGMQQQQQTGAGAAAAQTGQGATQGMQTPAQPGQMAAQPAATGGGAAACQAAAQQAQQQQPAAAATPCTDEPVPPAPTGAPPAAPAAPQIKDTAEYNAYMATTQAANPQARISGLEGFLTQFPNSAAKGDVLNTLMFLYSQTNNPDHLLSTAQKATELNPNNAIAWYFQAVLLRGKIENGQVQAAQVQQAAQQLADVDQKGLQALPQQYKDPILGNMTDDAFQTFRQQMWQEFVHGIGVSAEASKDYCKAQRYLAAAAPKANPTTPAEQQTAFVIPWQIAQADLEQNPINPAGFWWAARALNLAPAAAKTQLQQYATYKYNRYHGDNTGWDQIMASAATGTAPPPDFKVTPAPSPADQAAKMLQEKKVADMSLDEIQFILTSGNTEACTSVWSQIEGKAIAAPGKYIGPGSDPNSVQVAGLYDDINAKPPKADINLAFGEHLKPDAAAMPQPGADITYQGNPVSFTPNPFMMDMDKGCFIDMKSRKCITAAPAKAPTRKAPARPGTRRPGTARKPPGQ